MSGTRIGWPLVAIACLMLAASQASAANLLVNPGFEDPVTSGWSTVHRILGGIQRWRDCNVEQ